MTVSGMVTSASAGQLSKQLRLTFRMFFGRMAFTRLLAPENRPAGSVLFSVFMPALPSMMTASLRSMLVTKHSSATFLLVLLRVTICCSSFRSEPSNGPVTFSSATLKRTSSGSCRASVPTESTLTFLDCAIAIRGIRMAMMVNSFFISFLICHLSFLIYHFSFII